MRIAFENLIGERVEVHSSAGAGRNGHVQAVATENDKTVYFVQ